MLLDFGRWLARWRYYLRSIPTLLLDIHNPVLILRTFLGMPPAAPFRVRLRAGASFFVRDAMDIWVIKETCLDRDYEAQGVPLQPGWTVLDIGAALGDFAVSAARRAESITVHAFEPFPESFALLERNVQMNALSNVHLHPLAVSGHAGTLTLQTGQSAVKHSTAQQENASQQLTVRSQSLAQILDDLDIEQVDFLKMDCEGAEYDILLNTDGEVFTKIKRMSMEYHDALTPYNHHDLVDFLSAQGFRVRTTPNPAHQEIGFLYAVQVDEEV